MAERAADLAVSQARLRESEANFRLLAEHATDMVSRVNKDGARIYVSPASAHIFGVPPDVLAGGNVLEFIHHEDQPVLTSLQTRLLTGEVERDVASFRVLNPARGEVWVEASAGSLRDLETGTPDGYVSVLRDVTERIQLETRLRQAQRLEAVGQLTAGIAHDFNNMLQAIVGSLGMLQDQTELDAEGRECIEVAEDAAQRGATLVHRLLAFSRKQNLTPTLVKPDDIITDIAALLTRTLGSRIRVQASVADAIWPVHADAAQLENCLFNLALNARDAMPQAGQLRLRAENVVPEQAEAAGLPMDEYVCFAVEDNGTGMSPDTLAHAVEPYFTTKAVGQGTGLGLSMVEGFARQSGGDVRIESTPGQGTTVSLFLPRAVELTQTAVVQAEHSRGHILIADDEATVRRTLSMLLRKAGFMPVAVESGDAALELLRGGANCDLLISDQSMPGLTGCELIEAVAPLRPNLPTMLITGYDKVSGLDRIEGRVTVLRKPFGRDALLRQVQALLGITAVGATLGTGIEMSMEPNAGPELPTIAQTHPKPPA